MELAPPPRAPYGPYAAILTTFLGGVALTGLLARRLDRDPPDTSALDLAILGLATFKAARTLARDEVTSFLREPFVEESPSDPGAEQPVQDGGFRQAVGELVTCSRCVGTWAAAGMTAARMLSPRFGRVLSLSLAVGGANDWLQAGFVALAHRANSASSG